MFRKIIQAMGRGRAAHNPRTQLITREEAQARTATELVAGAAGSQNLPAMVQAMTTIAGRFEGFVQNIDSLNRELAVFREKVTNGLMGELQHLRYTTGERLNTVSGDLEKYVGKLDKVLWGALRAQGMSDDQIRKYREEFGMQPEAPRGYEIEAHIREVEGMRATIERLSAQNKRLIALAAAHLFPEGETEWTYNEACGCVVCAGERKVRQQMEAEAARG